MCHISKEFKEGESNLLFLTIQKLSVDEENPSIFNIVSFTNYDISGKRKTSK